ncbi:kinase-like domain-containing protein [Hypoxylon argillaceum]|nr:kinase-like domain-containing protein [Hypoxylon argillaceum]
MAVQSHICSVDAEPIYRYQPGGYHPIKLGDQLKNGRYKILHKVGWGGYSTTWAARDRMDQRYVAVKISVAEKEDSREVRILQSISSLPRDTHPGQQHIVQFFDWFNIEGPNGLHQCLVLELLGPSVPQVIESTYQDERLPASLAKSTAHQALVAIDFLAQQKIGHGDIHTRNIAFAIPNVDSLTEDEFLRMLGQPETGLVKSLDGSMVSSHVPPYLVWPTTFTKKDIFKRLSSFPIAKIIDFGESFTEDQPPDTLHTPLVLRAPEALFGEPIDLRVDLWSVGCLLFELFTGQPRFDNCMVTPPTLIPQMIEFASDKLPRRWEEKWQDMKKKSPDDNDGPSITLQEWLEEEDRIKIGDLVRRMLKLEPSLRSSVEDIANDPWFRD